MVGAEQMKFRKKFNIDKKIKTSYKNYRYESKHVKCIIFLKYFYWKNINMICITTITELIE